MPKDEKDSQKRGVTHNKEGNAVQGENVVPDQPMQRGEDKPLTDEQKQEILKAEAEPVRRIAEEERPEPKTGDDAPVLGGSSEPINGGEAHIQARRAREGDENYQGIVTGSGPAYPFPRQAGTKTQESAAKAQAATK